MNVLIAPECFHRHLCHSVPTRMNPDLLISNSHAARDQQVPDDGVAELSDFPGIKWHSGEGLGWLVRGEWR